MNDLLPRPGQSGERTGKLVKAKLIDIAQVSGWDRQTRGHARMRLWAQHARRRCRQGSQNRHRWKLMRVDVRVSGRRRDSASLDVSGPRVVARILICTHSVQAAIDSNSCSPQVR